MKDENKKYRKRRWKLLRSNEIMLWVVALSSVIFFAISIITEEKHFPEWVAFVTIIGGGCIAIKKWYIEQEGKSEDREENNGK